MPTLNPMITWLTGGLWLLFLVVWLGAALRVKATKRVEAPRSRLVHAALLVLGSLFMTSFGARGFLAWPLLPRGPALGVAAVAVTAAGIAFAFWARAFLGRNWSGTITLKEGHTLVTGGPYAWVRHPIYTGITLGIAGTALWVDEVHALFAVACFLAGFSWKIRLEERWMIEEFGDTYRGYQRRVKALIPFLL